MVETTVSIVITLFCFVSSCECRRSLTCIECSLREDTISCSLMTLSVNILKYLKFFELKNSKLSMIRIRGYGNGVFEVRTEIGGEVLGTFPVENYNYWTDVAKDIRLPDGKASLYFTFKGNGNPDFAGFELKED